VACVLTLFATCIGTLFSTTSIAGGSYMVSHVLLVYDTGFSTMFGISDRWAVLLSLPATWATAFGFSEYKMCSFYPEERVPPVRAPSTPL
jgi:hypothetical protein